MEKKKDKENIVMSMAAFMKVNTKMEIKTAMVSSNMSMEMNIMESGKTASKTDKGLSLMQMAVFLSVDLAKE